MLPSTLSAVVSAVLYVSPPLMASLAKAAVTVVDEEEAEEAAAEPRLTVAPAGVAPAGAAASFDPPPAAGLPMTWTTHPSSSFISETTFPSSLAGIILLSFFGGLGFGEKTGE